MDVIFESFYTVLLLLDCFEVPSFICVFFYLPVSNIFNSIFDYLSVFMVVYIGFPAVKFG